MNDRAEGASADFRPDSTSQSAGSKGPSRPSSGTNSSKSDRQSSGTNTSKSDRPSSSGTNTSINSDRTSGGVNKDRPSSSGANKDRPASGANKDRPSSGTSRMSVGSSGTSNCQHSRTSSASSGDGLLLSVSALARGGGGGREIDPHLKGASDQADRGVELHGSTQELQAYSLDSNRSSEGSMGQVGGRPDPLAADSPDPPERLEPEGTEGESSPGFSLVSVDKRFFGRLQEELTAAHTELKLKEEEVTRLSRIRDDVENELQDLTASLFQEAHKMVREANEKAFYSEKALTESNMKVDGLMTEVAALKALVITSTPSRPNLHLHPHHRGRKKSAECGGGSAPGSPAKERMVEGAEQEKQEKYMDPVLRNEFMSWKKSPTMDVSLPFLARIHREDVNPCLEFANEELAVRVREAVIQNTLCISPVKEDEELPRKCSLFQEPRRCTHRLTVGDTDTQSFHISQLARNRIAAVCDFLTYCRYVTQGLVKVHCNQVYWAIMDKRRNMALARLGYMDDLGDYY